MFFGTEADGRGERSDIPGPYRQKLAETHEWEFAGLKNTVRLCAMLILVWFPCKSQFEMRSVTGVVTDKRGNALPGAVVQVENTVTLSVMSYVTGKDGRYHFSRLNDDIDFILKARYRKYWSKPKKLSKFNSSPHPEVNLIIPID